MKQKKKMAIHDIDQCSAFSVNLDVLFSCEDADYGVKSTIYSGLQITRKKDTILFLVVMVERIV